MTTLFQKIETDTLELLKSTDCYRIPVPIDVVANRIGVVVEPLPLGSGVSGVLVVEDDQGFIGYNSTHASVRQRFTIAHEIGHFLLHKHQENLFTEGVNSNLFIDQHFKIFMRDQNSSDGSNKREKEANRFAAAILMPEELLLNELQFVEEQYSDDEDALVHLAEKFQVSTQAMSIRLASLGIV